ncbi:uncharacterized protein LOC107627451 [Arachis ipaensis]|uniref:uncharacterized protein LOC107627451 n=1 Tax=Arachis ipaensis TaxID=130454 RepID=UPI0007AF879C|nr:uncharacterized protein LOC107627451 [Arachis ipaensis]XP_025636115.1 uncharacterized protein LOC112730233 [Arachis hypogaea]
MADLPPPTPSELLQMVTELQQTKQRMVEENQRMANQIAELTNVRIENNGDRNERVEKEERESDPTHVFETARNEEARPLPENEEIKPDNSMDPFTTGIMNFQKPRRFTLPTTLTPYDGLGDTKKHIKKFRSIMIVNGASDPILCRCFPTFLDGPALDWFCSLTIDSISRFQELAKHFEDHFGASSIYLHDSDYLNTIKQGQNESLKDYVIRFTKVAMSIPDLYPEVHLHAIKSGLQPEKFQEAIVVAKPKSLAEFCEKAKGQMDIEELRQARKADEPQYNKDKDKARDSKKTFKLTPRYDSYTQFNMKRDDIIKKILDSKLIKPPLKAGSYPDAKNTDKSKYYTFHQKYGHTTDECVIVKDLLERLAREGHLDKYISGSDDLITTIHSDNHEARQCYNISLKRPNRALRAQVNSISSSDELSPLADLNPRADVLERLNPTEDLQKTPADMPGIDPSVISHKLALDPFIQPIAQKKRNLRLEKKQASLEVTKKLINAGFIQEI